MTRPSPSPGTVRKLRELRALSWSERTLLCHAGLLLVAAELGLRWFPFRTLIERVQRISASGSARPSHCPERIAWLVGVAAGNLWPKSTCLRQSLVLCALLRRRGLPARLAIGTTPPQQGFRAHAWVELHGEIIVPQTAAGYRKLISFDPFHIRAEIA